MTTHGGHIAFMLCAVLLVVRPVPAQDTAGRIDELASAYHDLRLFNGAVLVAEGRRVIYEQGFGQADMEWDVPNTPDTRFRIGSVTKQFTAALVLQLVEEGRIDLDAPVTDYLPDYPRARGSRVTAHHLLSHTSGIPNYTSLPGFMQDEVRDPYEPRVLLAEFWDLDLEFPPGSAYSYSDSGYYLLGVLIEQVTGRPYDEVLRQRLLEPLGLENTGYDHYDAIIEKRADGYVRRSLGYAHAPYLDTSVPYAAGMMYSTVRDLHAWTLALHRGDAFRDEETLRRMTTPVLQNYGYGLGVLDVPVGDRTVSMIRHSGGIFGFSAELWYMPEQEYTIAVLDNATGPAGRVADAIARVLYGQPAPPPTRPVADDLMQVIESRGVDAAVERYRTLKKDRLDDYDFSEEQLNRLGYHYLGEGDVGTAIRLFQLNVEAYPNSYNTYDSLGEAYLEAGDEERAIENYRRALALNPESESARSALERLGVDPGDLEALASGGEYVGRYELAPGHLLTVTREGGQLYVQATGQPRSEMFEESEDTFYLTVVSARITFHRDANGRITRLTLEQAGEVMPARRIE